MGRGEAERVGVLESKRNATRYRIMVELTARQPAVSQSEIADAIGVTSQAVSDYLQDLVAADYVHKPGRARYEVSKEGVDWLISQTAALREYTRFVSEEVVDQVDTVAAIAQADIREGQPVTLSMDEGTLHASPGGTGAHTAVSVTAAEAGAAVGVTDFRGMLEYDYGEVTILSIPTVTEGRLGPQNVAKWRQLVDRQDLLAVVGVEALATAAAIDREPDIRFGTAHAVAEAAARGVDVAVFATTSDQSTIVDRLREQSIGYEVVESG